MFNALTKRLNIALIDQKNIMLQLQKEVETHGYTPKYDRLDSALMDVQGRISHLRNQLVSL